MVGLASADKSLHGGISKVERHKWKIRGKMGEFMLLSKTDLRVDHAYQRDVSQTRALEFARDWSWVAFGAISVALREVDGKLEFWVIDGQHRLTAALLRSDVKEVPCLCFEVEDLEEEATGFYEINLHRGAVKTADKFRAMLVKRDPTALAVNELVHAHGRVVAKYSAANTVACVGALMACWDTDHARLTRLYPTLARVMNHHSFHRDILVGLFWLEGELPEGESLTDKRWSDRLVKVGADGLSRSIAETSAYYNQRTPRTAGVGVLKAINHGTRNKLSVLLVDKDGTPMT